MTEYTVRTHNDGTIEWYINGRLHNENGPAIEKPNGNSSWYLHGQELTEKEFNKRKPVAEPYRPRIPHGK